MNGHNEQHVVQTISVDKLIYPLLQALWKKYFKTEYSCQGEANDNPCAYILFFKDIECKAFCWLLETNGLKYYCDPREEMYGGGGAVKFRQQDIPLITELVESCFTKPGVYDLERQEMYWNFEPKSYLLGGRRLNKTVLTY